MTQSTALSVMPSCQGGDDPTLAERVERTLCAAGYSRLRSLEVSVRDHFVILQGLVPTYYLKQLAQELALSVPGVHGVRNAVEVAQGY